MAVENLIDSLIITSVETITGFDITTGDFLFTMDELQNVTIAQGQEKTDITGKQGRKLSSMKKNKTVTVSGTNGVFSNGVLAMQSGCKFNVQDTTVLWEDHLVISSNEATTSYKGVGTAGAEIVALNIRNEDGTLGVGLEQAATASTGKFAYDPTTKKLTFNSGDNYNGREIIVYYNRKINANVHSNDSTTYSEKCKLYIDAMAEDKCAKLYRVQFYIPKADFNGEFSFEMGDNQSTQSFEAESLAGSCGLGGSLWTYTVFGANTPDVN